MYRDEGRRKWGDYLPLKLLKQKVCRVSQCPKIGEKLTQLRQYSNDNLANLY